MVARARVASQAHIAEIECVAVSDLLSAWTILGVLQISAAASPNKPAVVALDPNDPTKVVRRISYSEVVALVQAAANRLHEVSRGTQPVISINGWTRTPAI